MKHAILVLAVETVDLGAERCEHLGEFMVGDDATGLGDRSGSVTLWRAQFAPRSP